MDSHHKYGGFGGFVQACKNLTQHVHWRASEIAFAETFARALHCPHYLLAVKHPVETLKSLLFQPERPRVYLSHPISAPRRRLADGDRTTFDTFCEGLERVAAALRARVTLFEPTTIDEFRFENFAIWNPCTKEPETVYLPALGPRWPLPLGGQDLLWSPVSDENPVDPEGHFKEEELTQFKTAKEDWAQALAGDPPNPEAASNAESRLAKLVAVENASHLVGALVGEIGRSVTARDLKLVEQSSHLVAVRPLFNGKASGGVGKEIREHCRLVAWEEIKRRETTKKRQGIEKRGGVWIFTSELDEDLWRRAQIAYWLFRNHLKQHSVPEEAVRDAVRDTELGLRTSETEPGALLKNLKERVPVLLKMLEDIVEKEFSVRLVPPRSGAAEDWPLRQPAALQAAEDSRALVQDLLGHLTPPYLEWPLHFAEAFDIIVPVAIYWGDPWPKPQDLEALFRGVGLT